jgi:hypothetical protein
MDFKSASATYTENGETIVVGRPALVMEFYGYHDGRVLLPDAEAIFDKCLSLLPADPKLFVMGTNDNRYKQLTPQVQRRLRKTLNERGGRVSVKTTPGFEVAEYSVEMCIGSQNLWINDNVVIGLPLSFSEPPQVSQAKEFFLAMVKEFPFWGAVAGLGFDVARGREFEQKAMPENFRLARRFHGLLVRDRNQEVGMMEAVDGKPVLKLKTAGWLTFLGPILCERVGGLDRITQSMGSTVEVAPVNGGAAICTGPVPPLGDVNRLDEDVQPLAQLSRFLRPVLLEKWFAPQSFRVERDDADAWLHRFD